MTVSKTPFNTSMSQYASHAKLNMSGLDEITRRNVIVTGNSACSYKCAQGAKPEAAAHPLSVCRQSCLGTGLPAASYAAKMSGRIISSSIVIWRLVSACSHAAAATRVVTVPRPGREWHTNIVIWAVCGGGKLASKTRASKLASKQASKQARERASKQARERASKHASKHASNQAREQASKRGGLRMRLHVNKSRGAHTLQSFRTHFVISVFSAFGIFCDQRNKWGNG